MRLCRALSSLRQSHWVPRPPFSLGESLWDSTMSWRSTHSTRCARALDCADPAPGGTDADYCRWQEIGKGVVTVTHRVIEKDTGQVGSGMSCQQSTGQLSLPVPRRMDGMQVFACKTISKAKVTSMEDLENIQREIKVRRTNSQSDRAAHRPSVPDAGST